MRRSTRFFLTASVALAGVSAALFAEQEDGAATLFASIKPAMAGRQAAAVASRAPAPTFLDTSTWSDAALRASAPAAGQVRQREALRDAFVDRVRGRLTETEPARVARADF